MQKQLKRAKLIKSIPLRREDHVEAHTEPEEERDEHLKEQLKEELEAKLEEIKEQSLAEKQAAKPARPGLKSPGAQKKDLEKLEIDTEGNIIYAHRREPEKKEVKKESRGIKPGEKNDKSLKAQKRLTPREEELKEADAIPKTFDELKRALEEQVGLNKSFDVVFREMVFGGQKTGIFYFNGFAKDTALISVLERLSYADYGQGRRHGGFDERENLEERRRAGKEAGDAQGQGDAGKKDGKLGGLAVIDLFDEALIPHIQVEKAAKLSKVIDAVSAGGSAFFFEGHPEAICVDAKSFPARSTEEPDLERVVRGSRDGFVETLMTNVTLVRRRVRDPRLKLELTKVGQRTKSDVCIAYISDICDMDLVEAVKDKIQAVEVDGLPLAEKQLEEAIVGRGWNPYPMVRYSERPDVVSAHLLEGHVIVMVDTSPSVMIIPTTFFHHVQHAEEYRQTPIVGSYLRWVRFLGIAASIFLLPLWYLVVSSPELKPVGLEFVGPQQEGLIPLLGQFLIAELGIDLMRMAAVHTPTPLATAMGLVAAILIGDIAVKTGLFVNEVIMYLAVAAVGTFATPSYELSLANRISRLGLLLAAAIFRVPGFVLASTFLVVFLSVQRSYNTPYMWPFIPFNLKAMVDIMVRRPFLSMKTRMSLTKTTDRTRQPVR
ncbi:spore germination protein [Paenibacillus caseinilyticus]|uniref:Stage V sporulation protein AF n=1 Tax=Paenibacillus mucilaginosus K02 TaxID=997761 RepID=I0BI20_9BACL|nr:spore germination protein [Paenibacillus mucilaginosus]AFH62017.1 stage V sporulation protein AF [Paenibacillus mucilaginosus K02]